MSPSGGGVPGGGKFGGLITPRLQKGPEGLEAPEGCTHPRRLGLGHVVVAGRQHGRWDRPAGNSQSPSRI